MKNFATCCGEATKLRLVGDSCEIQNIEFLASRAWLTWTTMYDCKKAAQEAKMLIEAGKLAKMELLDAGPRVDTNNMKEIVTGFQERCRS